MQHGCRTALLRSHHQSRATRGFCVGHVGPEATRGGPIARIRDGDFITIKAISGELSIVLTDDRLTTRRATWRGPLPTEYSTSVIQRFARLVGGVRWGTLTHPGAKAETMSAWICDSSAFTLKK